tara:strand:+ start:1422 stop:2450 length:1029 start_codon:yes stop_codon:yes gene_type:complete
MSKAAELAKMGEVLTNSQIGGRRNLLYNSKFEVAQRGTSFSGGTSALYGLDRWHIANGSSFDFNVTVSQSTTVPSGQGFKHSLKVEADVADTPTGSENGTIQQKLEAQDVQQLMYGTSDAKTLTLSFWVRSNKTGTYCVQFMTNQGNSTVGNRYVHVKEYTINSADTWEKKTMVLTGHTAQAFDGNDNSDGLRVTWHLVTGADDKTATADTWTQSPSFLTTSNQVNFMDSADNEWYLCGCQLEVGTATPFEHRSFGEELGLCQRYFETGTTYDIAVANGESDHQVWYRTTKRANATLALDNETGVTNHSTHYSRTGGFSLNGSAGAGGYTNYFYTWTADSEL